MNHHPLQIRALRDAVSVERNQVAPRSEGAKHLPYIGLEHIEPHTGRILSHVGEPEEVSSQTFAFDARHVLYGKLRPYLNKVALPDFAGRCSTELLPLLPSPDVLDRNYLAWFLRHPDSVAGLTEGTTGSRMPRADIGRLLALPIVIPPIEEQRRIASELQEQLHHIEAARTAAQAQLQALDALPAALLRRAFHSF